MSPFVNTARLGVVAIPIIFAVMPAYATNYRFHVSCPDKSLVVEWGTGAIDPGQEYLRVTTGTKYGGCSVSDYDPVRDANLPVERNSDVGGVIAGVPLLGPILGNIFHF
jgi:hypothetical protein